MPSQRQTRFTLIALGSVAVAVAAGIFTGVLPALWDAGQRLLAGSAAAREAADPAERPAGAELFRAPDGEIGLRLRPEAALALQIKPAEVVRATELRPLPPRIGTLNYDNDRLFAIRPRCQGELVWVKDDVPDTSGLPSTAKRYRPLRFGDRVHQGDLLAVVWSRDLGEKKAALVDAFSD